MPCAEHLDAGCIFQGASGFEKLGWEAELFFFWEVNDGERVPKDVIKSTVLFLST